MNKFRFLTIVPCFLCLDRDFSAHYLPYCCTHVSIPLQFWTMSIGSFGQTLLFAFYLDGRARLFYDTRSRAESGHPPLYKRTTTHRATTIIIVVRNNDRPIDILYLYALVTSLGTRDTIGIIYLRIHNERMLRIYRYRPGY